MNPLHLILGGIGGLVFVLVAGAFPRATKRMLFRGLVIAAAAYVIFSLRQPSATWTMLEVAGVMLYGGVASSA